MDLAFLTTIVGGTLATSAIAELVKRAWDPPADTQDRFMPLVSVAIGFIVVVLATFAIDTDVLSRLEFGEAAVTGIFSGLAACGLYDGVQGIRGK
jgi:hypothetical protein